MTSFPATYASPRRSQGTRGFGNGVPRATQTEHLACSCQHKQAHHEILYSDALERALWIVHLVETPSYNAYQIRAKYRCEDRRTPFKLPACARQMPKPMSKSRQHAEPQNVPSPMICWLAVEAALLCRRTVHHAGSRLERGFERFPKQGRADKLYRSL